MQAKPTACQYATRVHTQLLCLPFRLLSNTHMRLHSSTLTELLSSLQPSSRLPLIMTKPHCINILCSPLSDHIKTVGSALQTAGGSGGISSVQVKGPNTAWTGLNNLYGAEWELDTQPQLPLDLHIIADTGAEVSNALYTTAAVAGCCSSTVDSQKVLRCKAYVQACGACSGLSLFTHCAPAITSGNANSMEPHGWHRLMLGFLSHANVYSVD